MTILCLSILTVISLVTFGQSKKGTVSINVGFQQTDSYKKLFYDIYNDEPSYPTKQLSSTFLDFNLLYARQISKSKFRAVVGIGINQKGLRENGMTSDGSSNYYSYAYKRKKTFLGIYGGLSYDLLSSKNLQITFGQLLNPEIDLANTDLYKKVPLATRTNLTVSWNVSKDLLLLLTPYYQTALTNYNKKKLDTNSSNYLPYVFGLNLGIAFGR